MIELTINGAGNLAKWLDASNARSQRALSTAIKIEGFRLMRRLREEIKQGAPGGRQFAPLSYIRSRTKRDRYRVPLTRLSTAVRYAAGQRGGRGDTEVVVGFIDPRPAARQSRTFTSRAFNLSKSWLRLARIHQEGFWHGMEEGARKSILAMQSQVGPGIAKYFALRKSTQRFHTPARPIIQPFWGSHQAEALGNIRSNFRRKLAGERV